MEEDLMEFENKVVLITGGGGEHPKTSWRT
jgi:FlaA1/EpsC-like NDP-sugar epimerase